MIIHPDQSTKRLPTTRLIALRQALCRVYSLTVGLAAVGSTWATCCHSSRGAQRTMFDHVAHTAAAALRAEQLFSLGSRVAPGWLSVVIHKQNPLHHFG